MEWRAVMRWQDSQEGEQDLFDENGDFLAWVQTTERGCYALGVGTNRRIFPTIEAAKAYVEFAETYFKLTGSHPEPNTEI
jgi:hypothetical protein